MMVECPARGTSPGILPHSLQATTKIWFSMARARRREEQGDVLEGERAGGFGEADVVADEDAAFEAVEGERHEFVAGREVLVFAARGEEVGLVVGRDLLARAVEDVAGVENLPADGVGDGAADDVDLVFAREAGEGLARFGAVGVGVVVDGLRVEPEKRPPSRSRLSMALITFLMS